MSASALAERQGVTSTYITRVARFAMLSPALVDEIASGRQAATLNASKLMQIRDLPVGWTEQESWFALSPDLQPPC